MPLKSRDKIALTTGKLWGVPVQVKDTELNTIQIYSTLSEAANVINVTRPAIKKAAATGKLLRHRWIISEIDPSNSLYNSVNK